MQQVEEAHHAMNVYEKFRRLEKLEVNEYLLGWFNMPIDSNG